MAETLFSIDIDDVGNLIGAFEVMAEDADDLEGPLMEAGNRLQDMTIRNYQTEGAYTDFGFWVMLSPNYEVWKNAHFPGRQMLQLHNPSPLEDAVYAPGAVRLQTPNEVRYVIEDEKAAWHQFGAERQKGGFLPPRPIIPDASDVEIVAVQPVFEDWVGDIIDHGYSRVKDMPFTPGHPWFRPRSSLGTFLPPD